jgi:hypothetical protein
LLVIVASGHDSIARNAIAGWAALDALLLSPRDLSRPGWTFGPDNSWRGRAVVSGQLIDVSLISAIITRLPWVVTQDLGHIAVTDREYAAGEMTAFLLAWLSMLECPVVNRPTPNCLAGPHRPQEQWIYAAAKLRIPVQTWRCSRVGCAPWHNSSAGAACSAGATVSVIGEQCFGDVDLALHQYARRLAKAVGAALLNVRFTSPRADALFVDADVWPDLSEQRIADAVRDYVFGART